MSTRVLVVGAGPAGTACALGLRRAGAEVTVIDKATFPRDKCCGDGLTTSALRHLEDLGLDISAVPNSRPCSDVRVHTPRGRTVELALPSGQGTFAVIAPRMDLDHSLVSLCRTAAIEVRENCALVSVAANDASSVRVTLSGGEESEWDYVIAADGMWSPTRKMLGLATDGYLGEWHAFRQYVGNVTGPAATELHVWFEPDLLPGYAWSFPLPGNRANFGFGILREKGHSVQHMNDLWRDLLSRPHITSVLGDGFAPEGRHTAWPIPARVDTAVRSAGRVLFVGDAVCAPDLLTGEGIGQALETGMLAAQAVNEGRTPADVRARYSRLLDRHFLADHRMSASLGRMLASRTVAESVLRLVDSNGWTRRNFVRWMFEDEPRALVLTPRRWHRGFLKRPGAYAAR
ncbi:MAG: NAD(P)/FAD-dependent oxidoreductase [Ilumatobacteraceae bacterium]